MYKLRLSQLFVCCCAILVCDPSISFGAVSAHTKHNALGLIAETNQYVLNLSPTDSTGGTKISYRPNTLATAGLQVTFYDLTVAYQTSASRSADDDAKKGVTSYEDLRSGLTFGSQDQWMISGYYTRYGGLYIENSSEVDSSYIGLNSFIQRGDFSIFNYGASLMYVWNPVQFSLAAALFQSARQTESGGSLLLMTAFDGSQFYAESSIIPTMSRNQFGSDADLTSGEFSTASVTAGYGYTLTTGSLFLSGLVLIGPGHQWGRYTASGAESSVSSNAMKFLVAVSTGYNGETFYTALVFNDTQTENVTHSVRLKPEFMQLRAVVGFRF